MNTPPVRTSRLHRLALVLVLAAATALPGAETLDLDRVTPVPATQPIPVQDFFRPPLFSSPILNAAGSHFVAKVDVGGDRTSLLICNLEKLQLSVINGYKNEDVNWVAWLDDTHILSSLITDKHYAKGLFVTDAVNVRGAHPVEYLSATSLVGVPAKTPMKPLVWIYRNAYDEGRNLGVVQIDANKRLDDNDHAIPGSVQDSRANEDESLNGARAKIVRNFPNPPGNDLVVDYLSDKDGELAFAITADKGVYKLFRFTGKKWELSPVDLDEYYPVDVGDRPDELIVMAPRQDGKPRALHRLDAATGKLGDLLVQDRGYDITSASFYRHPVSHTILGVKYERSALQTAWLNESYAAVQKMVAANYPGMVVGIMGSNRTEDRFFFYTYSDRQPVIYYTLDLKAKTIGLIKNSAPWIDPARMQPMSVIKVKTRDEKSIEAYLTQPAGATKENPPPLVVLPHGGPHARDSWGYDGEVQFLASRGYAVLQVNYRGSTGYNWQFPAGDDWEFRKMHDDVTDAVKMLGRSGRIDPARVAIMGTSFGGYLALCGAAFEPDTYRCAITISGVFDWTQVINEKKSVQYDSAAYGIFLRNLGDPKTDPERFDRISPLRHIDQVKIPVFVAHGREDEVADVAESRALIAQLEKFHVEHESMLVSAEGHGMSFAKNQVELYSRIEAFLDKNLKGAR